jgi:hypothetical protein
VYSAVVPAGPKDANNKFTCLVPSVVNGTYTWGIVASTGDAVTDVVSAGKEADIPVAMLVEDGAQKAATETYVSTMATATGGSIDNIAPAAFISFAAANNVEDGILVNWTVPANHGIVGYYGSSGVYNIPIYGVDSYEVYRRNKGTEEWTLAGTVGPGSLTLIDDVTDGPTAYNYYVKAVDDYTLATPAELVQSSIRSAIATTSLTGDFTGSGDVGPSDFSIFAANYGKLMADDAENWIGNYDLNSDGSVGPSDFSIFAANYGSTLEASKAAVGMPTNDIPFSITGNVDESTSMYFVNVSVDNTESLKGLEFFLSYNNEALEFVESSVNGLVGLNMVKEFEDGIIRVTDWFVGEDFDGTITLGFRSSGLNRDIDFAIVNAMVDDANGLAIATNLAEFTAKALPTVYSLSQNYPNPFNPTTTIDYSIPKSGKVELAIYNIAAQKVRTLVNEKQDASFYKVVWDGRNDNGESVASGMYFYRLVSGNFSKIEKMTLVK